MLSHLRVAVLVVVMLLVAVFSLPFMLLCVLCLLVDFGWQLVRGTTLPRMSIQAADRRVW